MYVGECGCLRLHHVLLFFWACALERFKVAPVDGRVREQASGEGIHPDLNSAESSEKCLRGLGGGVGRQDGGGGAPSLSFGRSVWRRVPSAGSHYGGS